MNAFRRQLFLDPNLGSAGAGGGTASQVGAASPAAAPAAPSPAPISDPYKPPAGHRLVKEDQWGQYESAYKEYEGLKPLATTLKERNMDAGQLANWLAGKKQDQQQPREEAKPLDEEALLAKLSKRLETKTAWDRYGEREKALPKTISDRLSKLFGGKVDETLGPILTDAIMHKLNTRRFEAASKNEGWKDSGLPADITDDLIDEVFGGLSDLPKKLKGAQLAAIADAANKGNTTTTAGSSGGHGKPEGAEDGGRPLHQRTREQRQAAVGAIREKVSQSLGRA